MNQKSGHPTGKAAAKDAFNRRRMFLVPRIFFIPLDKLWFKVKRAVSLAA